MDSGFFESDSAHIAIPFEKKVLRHRPRGRARNFPPVEGLERNNLGYLWRVLQHFIEIFVRGRPGKSYYSKERWGFGDSISKNPIPLYEKHS